MKFHYPFDPATGGPGDGSVAWTNGNPATGTEGSYPPAEVFNDLQREVTHLIDFYLGDGSEGSGQDVGDLEQLRKAVAAAIADAVGDYLTEAEADALYLQLVNTIPDGMLPARLRAAADIITDWDDAVENGFVRAVDAANAPTPGVLCTGLVLAHGTTFVTQYVHEQQTDGDANTKAWIRSKSGGGWSAWWPVVQTVTETTALIQEVVGAIGPDDIGSKMYCGVNTTAFVVGASFAGTSLHPSTARNSSALSAGGSSGGSSASFELGTATLTGTWEALAPSEGAPASTVTRWADFIKVSD